MEVIICGKRYLIGHGIWSMNRVLFIIVKQKKYLSGDVNNCGYHRITLYDKGKKQRIFIHRLVATLFLPNPNNYSEVNHIDGNKNNN